MSQKTILVADADTDVLSLLATSFDSAGYQTRLASNSDDALKILAKETIAVMFIDLGLEPMNGFELCEQIRQDRSDAVIYALTKYNKLFGPRDIRQAGFDGYFAVPFLPERILQAAKEAYEKIDSWALRSRQHAIKRILIIDDDDQMRRMLRQMLELEGYAVSEASDGPEGIGRQAAQPADLIILDIVMPGKSGVETMTAIRKTDPEVEFIVVSGGGFYNAEIELDMAQTLGARALKKPFERNQLLTMIKEMHVSVKE